MYSCWSNLSIVAKLFVQQVEIPVCANSPWDIFTHINLLGDNNLQAHRTTRAAFFFLESATELTCSSLKLRARTARWLLSTPWQPLRNSGMKAE